MTILKLEDGNSYTLLTGASSFVLTLVYFGVLYLLGTHLASTAKESPDSACRWAFIYFIVFIIGVLHQGVK